MQLEKVYERCVLVTKKRYVGLTHEKPPPPPGSGIEGPPPALDCKGLEMVRRDTCPLVAQLMEKTLRVMLGGGGCGGGGGMDLSALRARLVRAWGKMLEGRVSPQEYTFAMEVRLGSYRSDATAPPAAVVARAAMAADPRCGCGKDACFGGRMQLGRHCLSSCAEPCLHAESASASSS